MTNRIGVILGALAGAYLLSFGILYLAGYRVYRIPGMSMQPTILKDEMVIGRLSESYRDRMARFDIAIYRTPQVPGEFYAKRIVGLPGERLVIDQSGVSIDGKKVSLPAAVTTDGLRLKQSRLVIPADSVFVLGDFTANSMDSRYLGPIPNRDVIGYLVFKK
jgi:signal peptidase I